jgi:hypothetical protein
LLLTSTSAARLTARDSRFFFVFSAICFRGEGIDSEMAGGGRG